MPRMTVPRFPRLAALIVAAVFALALAAGASADTPPGRGPGGPAPTPTGSPRPSTSGCAVLEVQLNGDQPATQACLAHASAGQGTDEPSTAGLSKTSCTNSHYRVVLYEHRNFTGYKICFTGYGTANLGSYLVDWFPYPRTWNDRVSSVVTLQSYQSPGYLYEHSNAGGARLRLPISAYWDLGLFSFNDRASSICLESATYLCR